MQLPRNLKWEQASTQWPSLIDPVLANPIVNGVQIDGIILQSGVANLVYHSLDQVPKGILVIAQNAAASIFQPIPPTNKTLTLEANANVTVSVWIF